LLEQPDLEQSDDALDGLVPETHNNPLRETIEQWEADEVTTEEVSKFIHNFSHASVGNIHDWLRHGDIAAPDALRAELLRINEIECNSCALFADQKKHPQKGARKHDLDHLPKFTSDLSGPFPVRTLHGHRWMSMCVSDKGMSFIALHRKKSNTATVYKTNMREWGARARQKWRGSVHESDPGGEYSGKQFRKLMRKRGVIQRFTAPDTSAGVAERRIRTVTEKGLASWHQSGAPPSFKGEAFKHANVAVNWQPSNAKGHEGISHYENTTGLSPPPVWVLGLRQPVQDQAAKARQEDAGGHLPQRR
jgi:hypothetical protein